MNFWIIIVGLLIHWVADFVLQTDEEAKGKSTSNKALTSHVLSYSFVWAVVSCIIAVGTLNLWMFLFAPITFACHWVTDYYTSRLNSNLWKAGKTHEFFVSIGFDQVLHYIQLGLTYLLLT